MLVINLFGAPGAGKSTGAAAVFSSLKMNNVNAELITEFAKDKVWEGSKEVFNDQLYILGKQNFKLSRVKGKVDVAVTDSPIILSSLYNKDYDEEIFNNFVLNVFNRYSNLNFFINRVKPYNEVGRFQTEEESDEISKVLKEHLKKFGVPYFEVDGNKKGYNSISKYVMEKFL